MAVIGRGAETYQLKGLHEDLELMILGPEIWLHCQDAHVREWQAELFHNAHVIAWLVARKTA